MDRNLHRKELEKPMKKQYKIHDFVVGMKVKLDSGVTGEVRSIYGMSNDMFIRGLEKSYSCTEVQEILFDPRTGKYAQDENPNATKEKPISLPDLDWACKNGVFRKEDGTWHIPDGYIKPGIKVKGCDTDSIFEVTKYNPESEIWNCTYSCARGRRTNSFYSIQMSLKVNGPEWSWDNYRDDSKKTEKAKISINNLNITDNITASAVEQQSKHTCVKGITPIDGKFFCKDCGEYL